MYLTGFADEAARSIEGQIRATKELGWENIESRNIDGKNIHDLDEAAFDAVCGKLQDAGVRVNCFGSAIANWSKSVEEPFDSSLAETRRAIPRMQRLGAKLVRIMSFAVLKNRAPDDQMEEERFRRVRELQTMFAGEGLLPVHENCMNYGGMGWRYTLRLVENVPGLKLVFDTGNPLFTRDCDSDDPEAVQSSWDFYSHVKEHIAYVHIKDGKRDPQTGKMNYTFPGEGDGDVVRIVNDLAASGYDGGISIEPHMKAVHHDPARQASEDDARYANYVEYGRRMAAIVRQAENPAA